jgi:hypothetical protein
LQNKELSFHDKQLTIEMLEFEFIKNNSSLIKQMPMLVKNKLIDIFTDLQQHVIHKKNSKRKNAPGYMQIFVLNNLQRPF